ncbi:MAG: LamG domain-containing protein [Verrucomicrobiales bacterium]
MLVGAPKFTAGKHGQSLGFDGEHDWVQLSPRIGNSTDWSFAGWVYWNGGDPWQRIFDLGVETDRFIFLTPMANGAGLRFGLQYEGAQQQLNSGALPTKTWTHVAVTIAGNTGKLFVNGQIVDINPAMTIDPRSIDTKYNYLGKSRFPADPLFDGRLDDVRFFSSARSDAAIAAIAGTPPPAFISGSLRGGDAIAGQAYSGTLSGLVSGVGALSFAKLSGVPWLEVSGDGALSGTPSTADSGENSIVIRVEDALGSYGIATLYVTVSDVAAAIASSGDDAEESADGSVNLTSTDLELVNDGGDQVVGLRFDEVDIPQGAIVTHAAVQFAADETQGVPTDLVLRIEDADDAAPFSASQNNISSRNLAPYEIAWEPPAWGSGQSGPTQRTPNLAGLVQEVASRPGWRRGNAIVLVVSGSGHRTAESFDKSGGSPAVLTVSYAASEPIQEFTCHPTASEDDAEEAAGGAVNLYSSDLELVDDSGPQTIGVRFPDVALPRGAAVLDARLQFSADETQSGATSLVIRGHDTGDAPAFAEAANDITSRAQTSAFVTWDPAPWNYVGERGPMQQSPNLAPIIGEIVARPGWASGNSLAVIISGSGHRTAVSADKGTGQPVSLTIRYAQSALPGSFSRWVQDHPGVGIASDDTDGDGLANLIEHAFGLDPWLADKLDHQVSLSDSFIRLTYTRPSAVTGIAYRPEWSDSLGGGWTEAGVSQAIVEDDGGTRTILVTIPRGSGTQRFLRIRVESHPG